jgi:hypothetical protein
LGLSTKLLCGHIARAMWCLPYNAMIFPDRLCTISLCDLYGCYNSAGRGRL